MHAMIRKVLKIFNTFEQRREARQPPVIYISLTQCLFLKHGRAVVNFRLKKERQTDMGLCWCNFDVCHNMRKKESHLSREAKQFTDTWLRRPKLLEHAAFFWRKRDKQTCAWSLNAFDIYHNPRSIEYFIWAEKRDSPQTYSRLLPFWNMLILSSFLKAERKKQTWRGNWVILIYAEFQKEQSVVFAQKSNKLHRHMNLPLRTFGTFISRYWFRRQKRGQTWKGK